MAWLARRYLQMYGESHGSQGADNGKRPTKVSARCSRLPGDAAAIEEVASRLEWAATKSESSAQVSGRHERIFSAACWKGEASWSARNKATELPTLTTRGTKTLREAAVALRALAGRLEEAQEEIARLENRLEQARSSASQNASLPRVSDEDEIRRRLEHGADLRAQILRNEEAIDRVVETYASHDRAAAAKLAALAAVPGDKVDTAYHRFLPRVVATSMRWHRNDDPLARLKGTFGAVRATATAVTGTASFAFSLNPFTTAKTVWGLGPKYWTDRPGWRRNVDQTVAAALPEWHNPGRVVSRFFSLDVLENDPHRFAGAFSVEAGTMIGGGAAIKAARMSAFGGPLATSRTGRVAEVAGISLLNPFEANMGAALNFGERAERFKRQQLAEAHAVVEAGAYWLRNTLGAAEPMATAAPRAVVEPPTNLVQGPMPKDPVQLARDVRADLKPISGTLP